MCFRRAVLRNLLQQNKIVNITAVSFSGRKKYKNHKEDYSKKFHFSKYHEAALFGSVIVGSVLSDKLSTKDDGASSSAATAAAAAGARLPGLPTYSAAEVSEHNSKASFWVTYGAGVYDVTSFVASHPGGEQIEHAAGLSVEPFWNVYGMHKTPQVFALLESYRIGNLCPSDVVEHSAEELWAREPARDSRLVVRSARPYNAETAPGDLVRHVDTPNELFYVRNHMPVPELSAHTHTVSVRDECGGGAGAGAGRGRGWSLRELARLPQREVRAALQCAGNRRREMHEQVGEVKGLSWSGGAIGCARWGGVFLRDVLQQSGVDLDDTAGKHVIFQGADMDATGTNFSTSIPLSLVAEPGSCVLLATAMNGAPLPRDHGSPLRVIVPGAAAVRSVKWLESITISRSESSSHWHRRDYRSFNASVTWESADWERAPPVYSAPVTSVICEPQGGDVTAVGGHVALTGYAYSGGGARIVRVDVSADRGRTWAAASLTQAGGPEPLTRAGGPEPRHYGWTLWAATLPLTDTEVEVWCKATDSNFNTQPESFRDIWNIRGILGNAYHKVRYTVRYD